MTRVILSHDVAQVDAPSGLRYGGNMPGRVFDMLPSDAAAVVKLGGALVPAGGVTTAGPGYRCACCKFLGYFEGPCSRCTRNGCECGGTESALEEAAPGGRIGARS